MAQALRTSFQAGGLTQGGLRPGLGGDNIFASSALDLNFGMTKSLGGLVTFTRASSGTYVDSQGVIRTATTNLCLQSENFTTTWTNFLSTDAANAAIAPNGTLTANTLIPDSGATAGLIRQDFSGTTFTDNASISFSIYVKAAGLTNFNIQFFNKANTFYGTQTVNASTGGLSGSGTIASTAVTNVGDGWYRVSMTGISAGSGATSPNVRIVVTSTGDGTSGIYLWGAQLEQSSTVGEYIRTTSTINSAPRFDHSPTTGESLGLLVEEQRTNLATWSQVIRLTEWTSQQATLQSINQATAPDGTNTANTLIENLQLANRFIGQTISVTNTAHTWSVFVKAKERRRILLRENTVSGAAAAFDVISGTVVGTEAGATATITPYTNGWYRCAMTYTPSASGSRLHTIYLMPDSGTSFATSSYQGDNTSGLYLWGAQLEAGAFPTSYIPTTTATVTRSADVASITGSNFGTFRTNLLLRSEEFDDASWSKVRSSIASNSIAAPNGSLTADKLVEDTTASSTHLAQQIGITISNSTAYTFSVYLKAGERSTALIQTSNTGFSNNAYVIFNLSLGTVVSSVSATSSSIVPVGNGWYRCSMGNTSTGTVGNVSILLGDATGNVSYTGDGTSGIYLWGAQLETGSTATAYIPTTTAAVTVFESSWYRQDEGTVFSEFSAAAYSTASYAISDGTNSNRILVDRGSTGTRYVITNAGVAQSGGAQTPYTLNSFAKTSLGYALDDCNLAAGGVLQTLDTSATIPSNVDRLLLGVNAGGAGYGNGPIKRFTFWPRRLSDPTLQQITQ